MHETVRVGPTVRHLRDDHGIVRALAIEPTNRRAPRWGRERPDRPRVARVGRSYTALGRQTQMWVDIAVHVALPLIIGFLVYYPLGFGPTWMLQTVFWVILAALLATTLLISVECARASRFPEPPLRTEVPDDQLPVVAVVVAAYLPNEQATIMESLRAHLAADYPRDRHLVVCAYNTPTDLPVEDELRVLAGQDERLVMLRVDGSTSKADNVEAALDVVSGHVDVVGFFDADHQPHPSSHRRVARWLSDAAGEKRFDMVQGQCLVRNVDDTFVTKLVAAEFATMYAVAHPGRTVFNDFGIFGGSNGWWRAPVIGELGMDRDMLTEDIDATARALEAGYRLGTDPRVVSTELAPDTWTALWRQRIRWAQGWWEVSVRHFKPLTTSRRLSGVQRRGAALLFGWRIAHPWIATQMFPLMAAMLISPYGGVIHPFLLMFLFTGVMVLFVPVLQAGVAHRLAPPSLRRRGWLFVRYAIYSMLFYSEFKAVTTRAASTRDLLGAHTWDITPRRSGKRTKADRRPRAAGQVAA